MELDTTDIASICELSTGVPFQGPQRGPRFPPWAGVLIGIGLALLAVGVIVTALLLRKRAHMRRRDRLEVRGLESSRILPPPESTACSQWQLSDSCLTPHETKLCRPAPCDMCRPASRVQGVMAASFLFAKLPSPWGAICFRIEG